MDDKVLGTGLLGASHLESIESLITKRFNEIPIDKLFIYLIDVVDEGALELLANQFNVGGSKGFSLLETTQERKDLIKRAIELNRFKGTLFALKEVIKLAGFGSLDIKEGFGQFHNGEARHNGKIKHAGRIGNWANFNCTITLPEDYEGAISQEEINSILLLIENYKNARSTLIELKFIYSNASSLPEGEENNFILFDDENETNNFTLI